MLKLKNHLNDCFLSLPFTHLFCNLVIRKRNRRTFPHTWTHTHTPLTLISFRSAIGREAQVLTSLWLISDSDSIRMPRWISQLESEFLLFPLFPSPFTFITLSRRIISTGPPLLIFLILYFIRDNSEILQWNPSVGINPLQISLDLHHSSSDLSEITEGRRYP